MADERQAFLELAVALRALQFGEFRLKSGRVSPYFFNAGSLNTGAALAIMARAYARSIVESGMEFDLLFGPAYKGIPLAAVTAAALHEHEGLDVPYAFNRKEAKDHGEGGQFVGHPLQGRVLILDDVITAGTAIREAVGMIRAEGATPVGVVIALDRCERGQGALSAVQEAERELGLRVSSIISLDDVVDYVANTPEASGYLDAIRTYRANYAVTSS